MLHLAPKDEWCGFIFFTKTDDGFVIQEYTVEDYGNHTFTDFEITPDQTVTIFEQSEKGRFYGYLHSHHGMNAYFSDEDLRQLAEGAEKLQYFVSLIVNNDGKWCARLAWTEQQTEVTYGQKTHRTVVPLESPLKHYFYTDLKIVREGADQEVTDPKALRLLALKKQKAAQRAMTVKRYNGSQPATGATLSQLEEEQAFFYAQPSEVDVTAHRLATELVIEHLLGNNASNVQTISGAIRMLTETTWKAALQPDRLDNLMLTLDGVGASYDFDLINVAYGLCKDINSKRSNELANRITDYQFEQLDI